MNILLVGNGLMAKPLKEVINKEHKIVDTLHIKHKNYKKNDYIDVVVDFSHPTGINVSLKYALLYKVPLIIGTTGFSIDEISRITSASKKIPICLDGNYSLVFNKFNKLVSLISSDSSIINQYVIETHHQTKKDSPSGSSLKLLNNKNNIYSLRGASFFGEHEVRILFEDEQIVLKHTANNKRIFANGVLHVINKITKYSPGLYKLDDFIKEDYE